MFKAGIDIRQGKLHSAAFLKPFCFSGENINICWSPDGQTIAVGNKDDVVTFIDAKTHRSRAEEQFKFEVNEISWNNDNNMSYSVEVRLPLHHIPLKQCIPLCLTFFPTLTLQFSLTNASR